MGQNGSNFLIVLSKRTHNSINQGGGGGGGGS